MRKIGKCKDAETITPSERNSHSIKNPTLPQFETNDFNSKSQARTHKTKYYEEATTATPSKELELTVPNATVSTFYDSPFWILCILVAVIFAFAVLCAIGFFVKFVAKHKNVLSSKTSEKLPLLMA